MLLRLVYSASWLFAALTVHELGHVLLGLIMGLRFEQLGVGPLSLVRSTSGLEIRWLPFRAWGPFAIMRPVSTERVAHQVAWLAAGGPLASICVGLAVTTGVWLHVIPRGGLIFGILNLCAAVATGQPFGTGVGIPSDGRRVWDLWRGDPNALAATALITLEGQALTGVRPAAWDTRLLQRASEITHPPAFVLAAAVAAYQHVADVRGLSHAGNEMSAVRRVFPDVPRWSRGDAAAEIAFWCASVEQDSAAAQRLLADARGPLTATHRLWRAESAVWLLTGNLAKAADAIAKAERTLCLPDSGATDFDRDLVATTHDRIRMRRAADHPVEASSVVAGGYP